MAQNRTYTKKDILLSFLVMAIGAFFLYAASTDLFGRIGDQIHWLQTDAETGLPNGSLVIEFYGGIDYDSATDEEITEGMARGRQELSDALYDMENGFYLDSPILMNGLDKLPPDVFWVDTWSLKMVRTESASGEKKVYYQADVKYLCSKQERDALQKQIDEATQEIVAKVPDEADTWTKALIVHDELVKLMSYDKTHSKAHRYDIYGALVEHEAVCAGYAKAFDYIMGNLGIYARYDATLSSADDDEVGHAWNYLVSGNGVYFIDATWDDAGSVDRFGNPYVLYDYYGLTVQEMARIDSHSGVPWGDKTIPYSQDCYHVHEGYFLDAYSQAELIAMFANQYERGANVLTVKFASKEAYEDAMDVLLGAGWRTGDDSDASELWTVIQAAAPDYNESISIGRQDELYVLDIYLYPA